MEDNGERVPAGAATATPLAGAGEQAMLLMVGLIVLFGLLGILAISGT